MFHALEMKKEKSYFIFWLLKKERKGGTRAIFIGPKSSFLVLWIFATFNVLAKKHIWAYAHICFCGDI